jgi:hypothetical protein
VWAGVESTAAETQGRLRSSHTKIQVYIYVGVPGLSILIKFSCVAAVSLYIIVILSNNDNTISLDIIGVAQDFFFNWSTYFLFYQILIHKIKICLKLLSIIYVIFGYYIVKKYINQLNLKSNIMLFL